MTNLDSPSLADDSAADGAAGTDAARPRSGPAVPTPDALTAHRPLAGPGATLTTGLLRDWQLRNREASLPLALRQLDAAGNLENMRLAARTDEDASHDGIGHDGAGASPGPVAVERGYRGPVFMDSDIYKTLEAIGWELVRGDAGAGTPHSLIDFTTQVIGLLEAAQEDDGYLNSYIQVSGEQRYGRMASSHEMYCAGHLIQAAVAMRRTAGDQDIAARLLTVATRFADELVATFLGKRAGLDGHPIIETALAELYRETGNGDYLALAAQFVEQRGKGLAGDAGRGRRYLQDYLGVREAVTLEGHAVRALYLEAGIVDVAVETGDEELLAASVSRWEDMVATKTYLTGGNGSRHSDEAFGDRYELPPDRAYNETCAAIASFHWSWRLLLATGEARYADLMERVLYNAFAAAISLDGRRFFYVNPLQRRADHVEGDDPGRRHSWFSCACCPPNIMRLLSSLQHYLATARENTLYVHQFTGSEITAGLAGGTLGVAVTTGYPWTGVVSVEVREAPDAECGLAFRVPNWSTPSVTLNGEAVAAEPDGTGYLVVTRRWQPGDTLAWVLDLTPRRAYPHPRIDAVRGCSAIERGPLVYCFEQADQDPDAQVDDLTLPDDGPLSERPAALPVIGPTVLVEVAATEVPASQGAGYTAGPADGRPDESRQRTATAIPYFQWDNRDGRPMRVWLPRRQKPRQ